MSVSFRSHMKTLETMDFFNHPYYTTLKNINRIIGIWPYQDRWKNIICRAFTIIFFVIQMTGQMMCCIVYIDDKEIFMEALMTFFTFAFCLVKCINSILQFKTMRKLVESIMEDETLYVRRKEKQILDEHAQIGRLFVHIYLIIVYSTVLMFISEPSIPYLNNFIFRSNRTIIHEYPVPIHWYFIDMDKHFHLIWQLESICIVVITTSGVASDSSFITFLQHARGLFVVVQHQFINLPSNKDLEADQRNHGKFRKTDDIQYNEYYIMCIKNHKRAFEFANLLEDMYVWCFGFVIGFSVPTITFTIYQLLTQSHSTQQLIKFFMFTITQLSHLFFDCYLSQRLIDESNNIEKYITLSEWCKVPVRSQKLLILVTLRSQRPCAITAGKLVTLSMETYGTMVKTAVSYFTVLTALQ